MQSQQLSLVTNKLVMSEKQPRLGISDAGNLMIELTEQIMENGPKTISINDRQIRFATTLLIFHYEIAGREATVTELRKVLEFSDNYLRERLSKLVAADLISIKIVPGPMTDGPRKTYAYILSDQLVAATLARRV